MAKRLTNPKARKYTDREKAQALSVLAANRDNVTKTSRELGIARKTLESWFKGTKGVSGITPQLQKETDQKVIDSLQESIDLYLEAAKSPAKIEKASLKDVNLSLAINIDKKQLLQNRPTAITQHSATDQQRLLASIKMVMQECHAQGVEIGFKEAASLLKEQMPGEAKLLDEIIEGEIVEEPKALLAA